jgi:hypothetical protein
LPTIERVWKLTRRLTTHNRYFATLPEIAQSRQRPLRWLAPTKQGAASIMLHYLSRYVYQ